MLLVTVTATSSAVDTLALVVPSLERAAVDDVVGVVVTLAIIAEATVVGVIAVDLTPAVLGTCVLPLVMGFTSLNGTAVVAVADNISLVVAEGVIVEATIVGIIRGRLALVVLGAGILALVVASLEGSSLNLSLNIPLVLLLCFLALVVASFEGSSFDLSLNVTLVLLLCFLALVVASLEGSSLSLSLNITLVLFLRLLTLVMTSLDGLGSLNHRSSNSWQSKGKSGSHFSISGNLEGDG
jgi:hypothetical protein